MNAVIWSGATNAADIFFLVAAILAGLAVIFHLSETTVGRWDVLLPAALCFVALGLLGVNRLDWLDWLIILSVTLLLALLTYIASLLI